MESQKFKDLLRKAGAMLAHRSYSRGELRNRLSKIAEESSLDPVLDRLEQLNLLNDADYAYNFALRRIRQQGYGSDGVRRSLLRKQVAKQTVEQALKQVLAESGDESALESYLQAYRVKRGLPADTKSLRRLLSQLKRRGFEEESILNALSRLIPAALWRRFETGE